jgi:hypothetical protein
MRCHGCEEIASFAGRVNAAARGREPNDLFCERCGVALVRGDGAEPVGRLALLARFGVAGRGRRTRRSTNG